MFSSVTVLSCSCLFSPSQTCLRSQLKAAPAVRLHVPHPADGLDLRVVGPPVVPVLVGAHFEYVLVATVAGVLVAHPAVWRGTEKHKYAAINMY